LSARPHPSARAPLPRDLSLPGKRAPPVSAFLAPVTGASDVMSAGRHRPVVSPLLARLPGWRLAPLSPCASRAIPSPPTRAVSSSPLCATILVMASSPVHATSRPFPAPGAYKRTTPSSPIPHTSLSHPLPPSPSSIEPASPRPSPAPVSLALLPLLSSSLIHIVLELRHSLTNTMHPSPPPIALGSLAGDLTAAIACHRTVDRPPQAPSGQIGPIPMIPYPRPCLATTPLSQNWALGEEPSRTSPEVEPDRFAPPSSPAPRRYPPPLADVWACTHDVRPRRSAPPWAGWAACPRPRSLGQNPPRPS
jgi:hypothetical protein